MERKISYPITFLDAIKNHNKKLGYSESLYSKVLVWSEDYESAWYLIHDQIPEGAKYFWANRWETYLSKFEKCKGKWKRVERCEALTLKEIKRIKTGPAFDHVPRVFEEHEVISWF